MSPIFWNSEVKNENFTVWNSEIISFVYTEKYLQLIEQYKRKYIRFRVFL